MKKQDFIFDALKRISKRTFEINQDMHDLLEVAIGILPREHKQYAVSIVSKLDKANDALIEISAQLGQDLREIDNEQ